MYSEKNTFSQWFYQPIQTPSIPWKGIARLEWNWKKKHFPFWFRIFASLTHPFNSSVWTLVNLSWASALFFRLHARKVKISTAIIFGSIRLFDCLEHFVCCFECHYYYIILEQLRITLEDGQLAGVGGENSLGPTRTRHTRGIHVNDEKQLYISILCFDVEKKREFRRDSKLCELHVEKSRITKNDVILMCWHKKKWKAVLT